MNKYLIGIIVVLLIGGGLLFFSLKGSPAPAVPSTTPVVLQVASSAKAGNLTAEGRVVPVQSAALSLPTGGVVAEILVHEGDQVQANQALLRLNQAYAKANLAQAEADLSRAKAADQQLRAGATAEELAQAEASLHAAQADLLSVSGNVTETDLKALNAQLQQAQAHLAALQAGPTKADLQAAQAALAQAVANLTTQRDQLSSTKTSSQLSAEQYSSALTEAQASYSTALQNWQYIQETNQDPITPWLGVDSKTGKKIPNTLNDAQRQQYYAAFVQAEAALHSAESALKQAQVVFDTARQAEVSGIAAAEQQVAISQANLDQLRHSTTAADLAAARASVAQSQANLEKAQGQQREGALAAAQATVAQAQAGLDKLKAGANPHALAVSAAELQRAEAAAALANVALQQTELHAPFAGTIAALDLRVGEYLAPGVAAVQLADLSAWQIETTDLTEQQIIKVTEGSQVHITIDALPDLELTGIVRHIRPLGQAKQGDMTYLVQITIDQPAPQIRWNMTASVRIE